MNPISLEAQVVGELPPEDVVRAAADANFDMAGIFIDPAVWTESTTRAVRRAFAETGVKPLEAEVIRLGGAITDTERRLVAIAAEIGLPYLIVVAMHPDASRNADLLAELGRVGAQAGVRPILEFGAFTAVPGVDAALAAVSRATGMVDILADPIHLARTGDIAADLSRLPVALVPFAQICDAGPPPDHMSGAALLEEARHHRRNIGEGMLDLDAFHHALPPGIPLSNEVRSQAMVRRYTSPFERATVLAASMRRWLAKFGE
jgi:sugar phosphate isomerase/epimerase